MSQKQQWPSRGIELAQMLNVRCAPDQQRRPPKQKEFLDCGEKLPSLMMQAVGWLVDRLVVAPRLTTNRSQLAVELGRWRRRWQALWGVCADSDVGGLRCGASTVSLALEKHRRRGGGETETETRKTPFT